MANESSYGTISAIVNSIWETTFMTLSQQGVMQPLVRVFTDSNSSTPRQWAQYSGGTVQTITEATDMAAQALTAAVAGTFTPAQFGAQYFLTDQRITSDWNSAQRDAGMDLGRIIGTKIDSDLVGNFSSFTGGTVGTAGGTLTWANIMRAVAYLKAQNAPGPYFAVVRPEHWYYLTSGTAVPTLVQSPEFMNSIFADYYAGSWGGINFFTDNNITSGTAAVGSMFARDASVLDIRRPLRIEVQRDASRGGGGYELNATIIYAEGIYRPTFGVQMIGTSA